MNANRTCILNLNTICNDYMNIYLRKLNKNSKGERASNEASMR